MISVAVPAISPANPMRFDSSKRAGQYAAPALPAAARRRRVPPDAPPLASDPSGRIRVASGRLQPELPQPVADDAGCEGRERFDLDGRVLSGSACREADGLDRAARDLAEDVADDRDVR